MRVSNKSTEIPADSDTFCELTTRMGRPRIEAVDPIGIRIRQRRDELRLTIRQVSDRSGVDPSTISRIETGKLPNAAFVVLSKVARGLDLSLDELADLESSTVATPPLASAAV